MAKTNDLDFHTHDYFATKVRKRNYCAHKPDVEFVSIGDKRLGHFLVGYCQHCKRFYLNGLLTSSL